MSEIFKVPNSLKKESKLSFEDISFKTIYLKDNTFNDIFRKAPPRTPPAPGPKGCLGGTCLALRRALYIVF